MTFETIAFDKEDARRRLKEDGWFVVPRLLKGEQLKQAQDAFDSAVEVTRANGRSTFTEILDPNESNVRLYTLPNYDPIFSELLRHPVARELTEEVLGPNYIVGNFTANNALPGSGSMKIHADQALAVPPPWLESWAVNVIWCLDDVHAKNGATLYLPGSHHYRDFSDVPDDAASKMVPFEAPAGSIIVMEGRLWHTSGTNVTKDEQRRMMFAYYVRDFVRPQINWEGALLPHVKAELDEELRQLLALGPVGNSRIGGTLTKLKPGERPDLSPIARPAPASA